MKNIENAIQRLYLHGSSHYFRTLLRLTTKYITEEYFMMVATPRSFQIANTIKNSDPNVEIYDQPKTKKPWEIATILYHGMNEGKTPKEVIQVLKDSFIIIKNGKAVDDFLYSVDLMAQLTGDGKLPIRRAKEFIENKKRLMEQGRDVRELEAYTASKLGEQLHKDLKKLFLPDLTAWAYVNLIENKGPLHLNINVPFSIDENDFQQIIEITKTRKAKPLIPFALKWRKWIKKELKKNYAFSLIKLYNASHFENENWDLTFFLPWDEFDHSVRTKKDNFIDYKTSMRVSKGFKFQSYPIGNDDAPNARAHYFAYFNNYAQLLEILYKIIDYRTMQKAV